MTADRPWPGDPGVPLHPERDGWHWLKHPEDLRPFPSAWNAELCGWPSGGVHSPQGVVDLGFDYLGPCYTQADLDAAVQAERDACLNIVKLRAEHMNNFAIAWASDAARNTASHIEAIETAIRARGPTSALDAALAQARRETWARAAEIAERVAIPEDCHGVEAHGRLMAAHAAADAIRSAAAGEEGK